MSYSQEKQLRMLWECFECDFVLSDDLSEPMVRNGVAVVRLLTETFLRYLVNNIGDRRVFRKAAPSSRPQQPSSKKTINRNARRPMRTSGDKLKLTRLY